MYKTAIIIIQNNDVQLSSETTKIHSFFLCNTFLQLQSFPLENPSLQVSPHVIDKLKSSNTGLNIPYVSSTFKAFEQIESVCIQMCK